MAGEVVRHGGTAVVAAIAPYEAAREQARALVEQHGRFVLVHLCTPLEVCEQRDVKGLYARARSGEIPGFTGGQRPLRDPGASGADRRHRADPDRDHGRQRDAEHGPRLHERDPDLCCALRKVQPLARTLAD